MRLTQNELRSLCKDVFSRFGAVTLESRNVYSVKIDNKKFYVGICENVNITPESLNELGLGNFCLISDDHNVVGPQYWSVSELLDFYVEKMYLNETGIPQVFSRGQ